VQNFLMWNIWFADFNWSMRMENMEHHTFSWTWFELAQSMFLPTDAKN
jgi:hypothetical protein